MINSRHRSGSSWWRLALAPRVLWRRIDRKLQLSRNGVLLLGIAIGAFIWLGAWHVIDTQRRQVNEATAKDTSNLARMFDEHISRAIATADNLLSLVRSKYAKDPDHFDISEISRTLRLSGLVLQISIIDKDGMLAASNLGMPDAPLNLSDREHFRIPATSTADDLYISPPIVGRVSKKSSIQLSRRISAPDGSFLGVAVTSIDPSYLSRFYNTIDLGETGSISLIGLDGIVRVRSTRGVDSFGKSIKGDVLFEHLAQIASGTYTAPSSFDGKDRIVSYRRIWDYPMVVTVDLTTDEALAAYRHDRMIYLATASIATLVLAAVLWLIIKYQHGLYQAKEFLGKSRQIELEKSSLLETTLTYMSQGLSVFDADDRLVICNQKYMQIYGLSIDEVRPGTNFKDIMTLCIGRGIYAETIPYQHLEGQLAQYTEFSKDTFKLSDGRVIRIMRQPMPNGSRVTIHEDITTQHNFEIELQDTQTFLKTVIDHVPATILVKDARDLRYILINRAGSLFFGLEADQILGKTVYDVFPKDVAAAMHARDLEVLQSGHQRYGEDRPLHSAPNGMQHVTTERLTVPGADGKPRYLLGIVTDITEQKKTETQIAYMAHHDALTGLANRLLFFQQTEAALARLRRDGEGFAAFLLDLDHFKSVNDSLGHPIGDALLKAVGERLQKCTRETDTVARLGGDEFAILQISDGDHGENAVVLATRMLEAIRKPYDVEGHKVVVDASIGIALAPQDGDAPEHLLKNADLALYQAKSDGRKRYCLFNAEMEAKIRSRHALENDLREALEGNEFELHYQTVIDTATRAVCGVEALVRWHHPERGLLSPDAFIGLAEETGLIVPLGEWVLRTACVDAALWPSSVRVAVNLSPMQVASPNLLDALTRALEMSGLPAERLELEITESVLLQNDANNLAVLHELRRLGVSIVLDDFGTGYSSLSYLQKFKFDKIKIDKSFVKELSSRDDSAAIVCAVVGLGKSLNIVTTAEGVETEEQFKLISEAGVDQIQGYLFSRPCPNAELDFAPRTGTASVGQAA
jgi:diguanylate cyclase (GGDEF)-like protein/PAS domain S-box-containing protein